MRIFKLLSHCVFLSVFLLCSVSIAATEYVGSEACMECHQETFDAWKGSQHQLAMTHASDETVYADFNDVRFQFNGKTNRFYRVGEQFWVNIEGADGKFQDYQIKYTFGVEPLQQYMVEFDDGRIQLIPFTWDTRQKAHGGQRWYHLYPEMEKTDEFYWMNTGQNWNYMCADCHSTNINKNFDPVKNQYNTTWSEISVGCEACHGPSSEHIQWANANTDSAFSHGEMMGFDRDLSKTVKEWTYSEGASTFEPSIVEETQQVQVCAQCHSRRLQLTEENDTVSGKFLDRYLLNNISPEQYHDDGQIFDENYVYGSFLQSKMAEKGVVCSDCHEPHSAKIRVEEEAICFQCHLPSSYTSENHTFHELGTKAAKCTTCHMPETTYMQIDPRRDHSWQIPRPDLSKNIGTPNVCTGCHEDKTDDWADEILGKWFPKSKYRNSQHFSVAFYADSINYPESGQALSYVAQNHLESNIIRSSALERLQNDNGKNAVIALARGVRNDNELIRLGAVRGSAALPFSERWSLLETLLNDPVYAIRTETAGVLVQNWQEMTEVQRTAITPALNEYLDIQRFNSDRGFGQTNIGNVYRAKGDVEQAIEAYLGAMVVEPNDETSYINLSDLYRAQGDESSAFSIINQGMQAQPKSATLPFAGGLSLLRQAKPNEALTYLKNALDIEPNNAHYWFVYGLVLESSDISRANIALTQAFQLSQNPEHFYARCELLIRHNHSEAKFCVEELSSYVPETVIEELFK